LPRLVIVLKGFGAALAVPVHQYQKTRAAEKSYTAAEKILVQ
jgi:hypothetical protein